MVDVISRAQYSPYMPSASIFFPVFGYTAADREAGIASSKERLWKEHTCNPSSHWIYVEDTATGSIVAGTQWEWNNGSPFKDGLAKINVHWWPEGEAREFCEEMLRQAYTPRSLWMHRPHASGYASMVNKQVIDPTSTCQVSA